MNTIKVTEARKKLSDLVNAAERGESVNITRRGRTVARLVPAEEKPAKPLPKLGEFRDSLDVEGGSMSETVVRLRSRERY